MSEYALLDIWTGPDQAKASIQHRLAPFCRSMWEQGIERLTVTALWKGMLAIPLDSDDAEAQQLLVQ